MMQLPINEQAHFEALKTSLTQDGKLLYAGRLLERAATLFGDSPFLYYHNDVISFIEQYKKASAFCTVLKKRGIKVRDRVLICFENSPDFYTAYYAVWQAGAVVIPVNTFLKEKELAYIIDDAQPRMVITALDRQELFQQICDTHVIALLTPNDMPSGQENQSHDPGIELDTDEMAALLYTSGTTGIPKGVMLSSRNIITNLMQSLSRLPVQSGERFFGILPLFHVFAQNVCVWAPLFMGASVILVPKIERRYLVTALTKKPTIFFGVPALYGLLCMLKTLDLDSVKLFACGADALPNKIRSYFELLYRRKICNGYGLTETSPVIAIELSDMAQPTNCIGKPVIGVQIQLRDEQGNEVPSGHIGELWVKGDNVMLGYYQASEQTEKVLKNGWFNTGDTMYMDEDGRLIITGRTKDLIINKGINIYPQEIENVLMSHPNVVRVAVVGEIDEAHGQVPVAHVQLKNADSDAPEQLKKLAMQHLASYKIPRVFYCQTDDLPLTATAKVDKKRLTRK